MTNEARVVVDGVSSATSNEFVVCNKVVESRNPEDSAHSAEVRAAGASWLNHVSWVVVALAILLLVVSVIRGICKRKNINSGPYDSVGEDGFIDDILAAVAKDAPNLVLLRSELRDVLSGNGKLCTSPLDVILRIEETYEKLSSSKYLRRISVLCRKTAEECSLYKIEREVSWEYIPDVVREQFIKTRENKVVRLVFKA